MKICNIFILFLVAFGFGSSLCVIKVLVPTPVEETQPSSSGSWHDIESWSFTVTTGIAIGETVGVFSIRPIDIYSYVSSEDDDFQKGVVQYFLWFIKKVQKTLARLKARATFCIRHRRIYPWHLIKECLKPLPTLNT